MFFSKQFDPVKDVPDLHGKVILVTGGNSGIGYATIQHLVRRGAKVYMGARNESKADAAIEQLTSEGLGSGSVHYFNVDMSDPIKAKAAAEEFLKKEERLDVLVNNAAKTLIPYAKSHHDIVDTMIINYLSPVAFTHTLLPLLGKTATHDGQGARIVNIGSDSPGNVPSGKRFRSREDFNEEYKKTMLPELVRYGQSKLAFILWSKELQRRLSTKGSSVITMVADPGATLTPGTRSWLRDWSFFSRHLMTFVAYVAFGRPEKASYSAVFAAASATVHEHPEEYRGAYIATSTKIGKVPSADADSEELAKELWTTTETLLTEIGAWKDVV